MTDYGKYIEEGKAVLGIEFGSTRIKSVLIGPDAEPIAVGGHSWENQLEDGIWTYSLESVWEGLQDCYSRLREDVERRYGCRITNLGAIGFSGMMHGYMAFDEKDELMVPFRTWRNTITGQAAEELSRLFHYHIPQRWSIAHLYQAMLNGEEHVGRIRTLMTLAGYIHWQLSGEKVIGVGEASGMFPIDADTVDYNEGMIGLFEERAQEKGYSVRLREILPQAVPAGCVAGYLTPEGAARLDVTGSLRGGIPLAPAEGDAGTGMVATNSVRPRTGNVSAGTSVFGMLVLERDLKQAYEEIDLVTTPDGSPVAMAHCNNCTSDLNAWVNVFGEFAAALGQETDMDTLYGVLYSQALKGEADCGGLLAYNYFSGEHITGFEEGRPLFVRRPDSHFTLANFMRTHLYASLSVLKIGMDILFTREGVEVDKIYGHGGLFRTKGVGQSVLAAALDTKVSVMTTAGEGGAWGMAVLAAFMLREKKEESLADYLDKVYADARGEEMSPDPAMVEGFRVFSRAYQRGLAIERAAVDTMNEREISRRKTECWKL